MTQSDNMLTFSIVKTSGAVGAGTRLGKLLVADRNPIKTPSYIAITSRGLVPHLSPDSVDLYTSIPGVYLALEDFIEKQPQAVPPIYNLPESSSALKNFLGISPDSLLVLSPRRTPPVPCPASNTATAISILTSVGFHFLTNESYVEASVALKPDITVGMGDVIYGAKTGIKRVEKMSDRTTDWTKEMITAFESSIPRCSNLFAPILALDAQQQSHYLAFLEESLQEISGLALYSSNALLSLPSAISQLPRLALTEPSTPHAVLSEIRLGIDIHTIPFITTATDNGIALSFTFPATHSPETTPAPLGTNMWLPAHSTSLIPLAPDCTCYACTRHHRAYIQHLLVAKEMLGWVLLQIHNLATVDRFYEGIRDSIDDATFDSEMQRFEKVYESSWPEVTGVGPRLRGYQFKSEGPGEKKRNVKAYGRFEDSGPGLDMQDKEAMKPEVDLEQLENIGFAEKQ